MIIRISHISIFSIWKPPLVEYFPASKQQTYPFMSSLIFHVMKVKKRFLHMKEVSISGWGRQVFTWLNVRSEKYFGSRSKPFYWNGQETEIEMSFKSCLVKETWILHLNIIV